MTFSFSSLIRLIVLLSVGATMLAVGVSRLDPPRPDLRTPSPASHAYISGFLIDRQDPTPRWLDVDSGGLAPPPLAAGEAVDQASPSPWVDEKGRRQVVGRWTSRSVSGPSSRILDQGLARYRLPDGKLLDQVSTEVVPIGPIGWFSGTQARILFTGGDGLLYHFAFEPEPGLKGGTGPGPGRESRPRPLNWRCRKPGAGLVFLSDLQWPEDPRMGDRVVVSLMAQMIDDDGVRHNLRPQIWWLKLDSTGTEIVEAGRLVTPDLSGDASGEFEERCPSLGALADGRLALAYLRQRKGASGWEARMAPIRFEGEGQVPTTSESACGKVEGVYMPARPTFSTDGRWLNLITERSRTEGKLARVPTGDVYLASARR